MSETYGNTGNQRPTGAYQNRYDERTQKLLEELLNRGQFSYDAANDPLMSQYKKTYNREGQRATQDALGAASAATGGIPSSYAVTAAAQAGNYYASQLADKLPELEQYAYQKYLDDYDMKRSDLSMLTGLEDAEFQRYTTDRSRLLEEALTGAQYGDYTGLRNFGYDTSAYENEQQNIKRWDEALRRAEFGDYSGLVALGVDMGNNPAEWEKKFELAQLAAQYGDYSKLRELGINVNLYSGGGYSGSGGSQSGTTGEKTDPVQELIDKYNEQAKGKSPVKLTEEAADWLKNRADDALSSGNGLASEQEQYMRYMQELAASGATEDELAAARKKAKEAGIIGASDFYPTLFGSWGNTLPVQPKTRKAALK